MKHLPGTLVMGDNGHMTLRGRHLKGTCLFLPFPRLYRLIRRNRPGVQYQKAIQAKVRHGEGEVGEENGYFLSSCGVKRYLLLPPLPLYSQAFVAMPTLYIPVVAPRAAGTSHLAFLLLGI